MSGTSQGRDMKTKICLYSHFFYPNIGGVEKLTYLLAKFLSSEKKFDVTLVTMMPSEGDLNFPFKVVRKPSILTLQKIIMNSNIIHMQGFNLPCFIFGKIYGKPIIWNHQGYDLSCPKYIGWNSDYCTFGLTKCYKCLRIDHSYKYTFGFITMLYIRRICMGLVDAHVSPSRYVLRNECIENGILIPNCVDSDLYRPFSHPDITSPPRLLFIGRLIKEKGAHILVKAVKRCIEKGVNVNLVIVGDGYQRTDLENLVKELGLENTVIFLGSIFEEDDLIKEIQNSTAVVVPTLNAEPFGIVALEAMSCAKPVLASKSGGLTEILQEIGVLIKSNDEKKLADEIMKLILNPERGEELGRKGRKIVLEKYDFRKIGKMYISMYTKLIENSY